VLLSPAAAFAQIGACCLPNGSCIANAANTQCQSLGGSFINGGSCTQCSQDPRGACCREDVCAFILKSECIQQGFTFLGGSCQPNPCNPAGACCTQSGGCVQMNAAECASIGGTWLDSKPCSVQPCTQPPLGACCNTATGGCSITVQTACNGLWIGNAACSGSPCTPLGACCRNGVCTQTPKSQCIAVTGAPGTWFPNLACSPTFCPPTTGACCTAAAGCQVVPQNQCPAGVPFFSGQTCNPNPCNPTAACCLPDGSCFVGPASQCSGHVLAPGTTCQADTCPRGACCNLQTGQCIITYRPLCESQGLKFIGPGTACTPTVCPATIGACCIPGTTTCVLTSKSKCQGTWKINTTCTPNPCCPVNFSGSGTVSVDDIFIFINAWFRGCP
jgi:hypothetical protein